MTDSKGQLVNALAQLVDGRIIGDGDILIHRIANLDSANENEIAYVDGEKFFEAAQASKASCLIVRREHPDFTGHTLIEVENPKLAFSLIAATLHPAKRREPFIHSTASIADSADVALTAYLGPGVCVGNYSRVGAGTRIEAGVVIGDNVVIGADCVIHPNVVLYDGVTIGDNVILHAAVCIGADGFGYVRDRMGYHKFPQIGTVVIEDDVE
jgi:UDP-3-O-[3-hydroxymyristoyl] glucosamine N-acyltransferase